MDAYQSAGQEVLYKGDSYPGQQFQLYDDVTGDAVDFTAFVSPTVTLHLREIGGDTTIVTKAATFSDPSAGWVQVEWEAADLVDVTPGLYECFIVVDTGSGVWTAQNVLRYRVKEAI